jgi:small subunit ribosomal protein S21
MSVYPSFMGEYYAIRLGVAGFKNTDYTMKAGVFKDVEIRVNDNDVEKALKVLKRLIQKEGLLGELKKRRYFEKPSVKLRRKQREAQKRRLKSSRRRKR